MKIKIALFVKETIISYINRKFFHVQAPKDGGFVLLISKKYRLRRVL